MFLCLFSQFITPVPRHLFCSQTNHLRKISIMSICTLNVLPTLNLSCLCLCHVYVLQNVLYCICTHMCAHKLDWVYLSSVPKGPCLHFLSSRGFMKQPNYPNHSTMGKVSSIPGYRVTVLSCVSCSQTYLTPQMW